LNQRGDSEGGGMLSGKNEDGTLGFGGGGSGNTLQAGFDWEPTDGRGGYKRTISSEKENDMRGGADSWGNRFSEKEEMKGGK